MFVCLAQIFVSRTQSTRPRQDVDGGDFSHQFIGRQPLPDRRKMNSRKFLLFCLSAVAMPSSLAWNSGFAWRVGESGRGAYLETASESDGAERTQRGGGMRTTRQSTKQNLKNALPQAQVTAISHCGEMYRVTTADGKLKKFREFNLRFKTDSSEVGPRSGMPVMVSAGRQGDRASVVFAGPSEISTFITEACSLSGDDAPF